MVTKWTARSRQKLLVLWVNEQGLLMASGLNFEGDVREPDEACRAHLAGAYSDQELAMAQQLLTVFYKETPTALSMEVDEAVALKHALVADALAGQVIDAPEKPKATEPVSALADALSASIAALAKDKAVV